MAYGAGRVDVDAQDLAEQRVGVLAVAVRVAAGAAVAEADVQVAVRAEGELAAVVVRVRLVDVSSTRSLAGRARRPRLVGAAELGEDGALSSLEE